MVYFSLFVLELFLLFILSKQLIKSLSLVIYRLTKSQKVVVNTLAVLFLPGTIVHELSHLLTAGVMLVPVGEISVIPEIGEKPARNASASVTGGDIKLGSVQIGKVDPFRLTIVGVAPVILGLLSILGIVYFGQISKDLALWQLILGLFLIFQISNTMFSSKKDIEGTLGFVIGILVALVLIWATLYFWKPEVITSFWEFIKHQDLTPISNFFKLGSFYLLIPLILDFLIITLARPFIKHL